MRSGRCHRLNPQDAMEGVVEGDTRGGVELFLDLSNGRLSGREIGVCKWLMHYHLNSTSQGAFRRVPFWVLSYI